MAGQQWQKSVYSTNTPIPQALNQYIPVDNEAISLKLGSDDESVNADQGRLLKLRHESKQSSH